MIWVDIEL